MSDPAALPKTCPHCGAALPCDATEGLCPRCLLNEVMQSSEDGSDGETHAESTVAIAHPAASRKRSGEPDLPQPEELEALLPKDTFHVESLLGQGGMGAVYKGWQVRLKRAVAIKIMHRDQGRDHDFEQRFEREALAMAKLNHPNIVSVIDYGEAGPDYLYIVMELIDGADLMDVIRTQRMTQEMALALLPQICDALQFAHDHGIVHRDIKPGNIMLTRDGLVKIADFGLAKHFDIESNFRTQAGTGMGTPDYAAPEQFMERAPVDHRADIFALGVMIYQMITGALPRGAWKPPSQRAAVDPQWDEIVNHAMQSDPADRYQKASEIKSDVSRITPRTGEAPAGGSVPAPAAPPAPRHSRSPLFFGLAAALAAGVFFTVRNPWADSAPHHSTSPQLSLSSVPASATKEAPFVNSLGMRFLPVPITGGPTNGQRVLFSVWDTRVQDYEVFAKEKQRDWPKPIFEQGPTHPAVDVSWDDAQAFCAWLTDRERKLGMLGAHEGYRLPSDHEWSCAVGIGDREDPAMLPGSKANRISKIFAWGAVFPPPDKTTNIASEELRPILESGKIFVDDGLPHSVIKNYHDGYAFTSPVESFPPNQFGLYDMGGNVQQWCEDWNTKIQTRRTLRGASYATELEVFLQASNRPNAPPTSRYHWRGFRAVLARSAPAATRVSQ